MKPKVRYIPCQNIQPFSKVWVEDRWLIPHMVNTYRGITRVLYWTGREYITKSYNKGELVCSQRKNFAWFFGWH
jgi:hypothetical protein